MKKRDSKRRWIARCRLGKAIPFLVIMEHGLGARFVFETVDIARHLSRAVREG